MKKEETNEGTLFYTVRHNSFVNEKTPWISSILTGLLKYDCFQCGVTSDYPTGDIEVCLDPKRGHGWPDVLGCGAYPLLIVSRQVLDSWTSEEIGPLPSHEVNIVGGIPSRLRDEPVRQYFWIDGKQIPGAKLDVEASGFSGSKVCEECGRISYDIKATYAKQELEQYPYAIFEESWKGSDLFTTDFSYALFFCTKKVLELAYKYQLTNFRFLRVEQGADAFSEGINYLSGDFYGYYS